jgi:hypothetical protein
MKRGIASLTKSQGDPKNQQQKQERKAPAEFVRTKRSLDELSSTVASLEMDILHHIRSGGVVKNVAGAVYIPHRTMIGKGMILSYYFYHWSPFFIRSRTHSVHSFAYIILVNAALSQASLLTHETIVEEHSGRAKRSVYKATKSPVNAADIPFFLSTRIIASSTSAPLLTASGGTGTGTGTDTATPAEDDTTTAVGEGGLPQLKVYDGVILTAINDFSRKCRRY